MGISDGTFSLASAPYSFNGGAYGGSSSAEVFKNGNYSFTVMDSEGRTASESVTVGNIDTEAPKVSLSKSTGDWTEEGLTITASASDDLSGLSDAAYSFGGGFSSGNSLFVTQNGTYSVTVCDRAGNTASASIEISNIGKDPAIIAAEEEERRRKEEEERRRQEEEEEKRRKEEEEEKRRKEEEEKKKEEEEKKKEEEDKKDDDTPGSSGGLSGLIGRIIGKDPEEKDVSENDTSGNDISENDVSGNLIPVVDASVKTSVLKDKNPGDTTPTDFSDMSKSMSMFEKFLSLAASLKMFIAGLLLVILAAVLFSSINFIYTYEEGKIRPIAVAKVKKDRKKLFVSVPSKFLKPDGSYKVFYSLWSRLMKKDCLVIIDVDGHSPSKVDPDGNGFVYCG